MKIKIENETHSEAVQKALFANGYKWNNAVGATKVKVVLHETPVLWTSLEGEITYSGLHYWNNPTDGHLHEERWLIPGTTTFSPRPPAPATEPTSSTDAANPKAAIGSKALPMSLFSPLARALGSLGKLNGKGKYGGANFIGTEVVMSIYIDAIERHLDAIKMGEDADPIDNVPHWGAILANVDIIVCAAAAGTLIDDRLRADGQLEAVRELKPLVASLQELHKDKDPKHYYMKNKEADNG